MTPNNPGANSASTNDWLEAMKNQSSSCAEPTHTGSDPTNILTREHFEEALKRASRRVAPVEPKARKKG